MCYAARVSAGLKKCRKCGELGALDRFRKTPVTKDGYTSACRACLSAADRARQAAKSPEERQAQRDRYRHHKTKWRENNRDKIADYTRRTRSKNSERHAAWRKANPEKFSALIKVSGYRRRAAKAAGATAKETLAWANAQKKRCYWCNARCPDDYHIDHYVPLSRGGLHEIENLVIACPDCNRRKSAKDPLDFAQEVGRLL